MRLAKSFSVVQRMAAAMTGAASLPKPAGPPRFRKVMTVRVPVTG
jgi:hypothetical protein